MPSSRNHHSISMNLSSIIFIISKFTFTSIFNLYFCYQSFFYMTKFHGLKKLASDFESSCLFTLFWIKIIQSELSEYHTIVIWKNLILYCRCFFCVYTSDNIQINVLTWTSSKTNEESLSKIVIFILKRLRNIWVYEWSLCWQKQYFRWKVRVFPVHSLIVSM